MRALHAGHRKGTLLAAGLPHCGNQPIGVERRQVLQLLTQPLNLKLHAQPIQHSPAARLLFASEADEPANNPLRFALHFVSRPGYRKPFHERPKKAQGLILAVLRVSPGKPPGYGSVQDGE
jgi:hypothetical protein